MYILAFACVCTYSLRPAREIPFGADQPVRVQHAVHHRALDHIGADDARRHRVRVLAPRRLRDRLPRMADASGLNERFILLLVNRLSHQSLGVPSASSGSIAPHEFLMVMGNLTAADPRAQWNTFI